ncbi:polyketide synthase [Clostridium sp. BNL1100]|uniref:type I polyketide synthase n=1 Tax=Clostridium sp. BNL1100 TaxID=755731 RepID=UPI00024A7598|nr:polyketide synthase [Clostridium sp. BNL1100]AEY65151.1 beta-ketoacyl synthase family protein,phosphopantetheine-containing protein [Clostridium sp. BNL1100]
MVKKLLDLDKTKSYDAFSEEDNLIKAISNRDIAIIGIACEFPKASDVDQYWEVLRNGVNCMSEFTGQRKLDTDNYLVMEGMSPDEIQYSKYAYIKEIDKFDYEFFHISPKEAQLMDPKQRMFLETAWKAIEDAGYGGKKIVGTRTGVYLGYCVEFDYEYKQFIEAVDPSQRYLSIPGNIKAIVASRISYILNLKGPSMTVDTTCSSSLVATHLACQAIRNEECEMAISGAIKIRYLPEDPKDAVNLGINSSDGITRTFDDYSDGVGSGEGVGAVLLKPLNKAIEDGDHIYAVIKGTAINQDGTTNGITAPNPAAQEEVIIRAWKDGKIDPETISYIEAHGTGTKLGDPIEIEGITRAFNNFTQRKQFCAVGSVKSNLGHLDDAAGIAGLIKTALVLDKKEIPPLLNFSRPNRAIDFTNSPVYINDRIVSLQTTGTKARCGISAFGFSGTNCHMVLEEAPQIEKRSQKNTEPVNILTISAKSKEALIRYVELYKDYFSEMTVEDLNNICFTVNTGRDHLNYRIAIVLDHDRSIKEKLDKIDSHRIRTNKSEGIFYGEHKIASLFNKSRQKDEISEEQRNELSDIANKNMDQFLSSNQLNTELVNDICEKYVQGANVEWEKLYGKGRNKRVRIPTYPFLKNRCWLDVENANPTNETNRNGVKNGRNNIDNRNVKKVNLSGRDNGIYTDTETSIAEVWAYVLGLKEINIFSSFFELGGDSLLAIQLKIQLGKTFNKEITLQSFFMNPTITELAEIINKDNSYADEEYEEFEF